VGIDLHRRRSVIVRINDDGEVLETKRVVNDPIHPLGLHWDSRRVKNEVLDATELARRLSPG